jgi:hypothetical protein
MKKTNNALIAAALSAALVPAALPAQEEESGNGMIQMTRVYLEPASWMKFGSAMEEYVACYAENGGEDSWSAWRDMEQDVVWIVSSMDGWADMDEGRSEANRACYPIIEDKIGSLVRKVKTEYARYLPEWSGEAEDYQVVRLHQFTVDEDDDFREIVGEMTSTVKEADYEHVGAWYDILGNDADEIDYFVVSRYANFAAMDEDRPGYYGVMTEAMGEEETDAMWERFYETLAEDGRGYKTVLLARAGDWGYDPEED